MWKQGEAARAAKASSGSSRGRGRGQTGAETGAAYRELERGQSGSGWAVRDGQGSGTSTGLGGPPLRHSPPQDQGHGRETRRRCKY